MNRAMRSKMTSMNAELSLQDQSGPAADGSDDAALLRTAPNVALRRLAFALPVAALTVGALLLAELATRGAHDPLRWPLLFLLAPNLLYMAATAWPGVLGGLLRVVRGQPHAPAAASPSGLSRTALVMPVYEEDPATVFAAVETMVRDIAAAGLRNVDVHVLSDTQSVRSGARETAAYAALVSRLPDGPGAVSVHYRRRQLNLRRKVGNVAEFCAEWAGRYDYMVVLDADSLMGARTLGTLVGLMDANPRAGIIQTVPYPVGRETPFARSQQFAARLYTPMLAEGLRFWQGSDANYWGHNAILRIAPFVTHCELPVLSGREPFGGEILCHDVVEAGMMRAAGWDVWILPETTESFESLPANMVDFTVRERRWCQGNLQHLRVLAEVGLRPVGRFHILYGIFCYLAGPFAAAFLCLATADLLAGPGFMSTLLSGGSWAAGAFGGAVFALLYGFKLLALGAAMADRNTARSFGGRWTLLGSAACEQVAAFAISPVLTLFYTWFVLAMLSGQSVRWDTQPRDDRGLQWSEAWARLRVPTKAGALWLLALGCAGPGAVAWAAPLWAGLLLSVPVAVWSSRLSWGRALRRSGLFGTPEELVPPSVLRTHAAPRPAMRRPRLRLVASRGLSHVPQPEVDR